MRLGSGGSGGSLPGDGPRASGTGGPLHVVIGPPEHGVVRFGLDLAREAGARIVQHGPDLSSGWPDTETDTDSEAVVPAPAVVQLHWTDSLFDSGTVAAAAAFTGLITRIRHRTGASITATLHDLPDPDDEPGRYRRRSGSYRRVLAALDAATVSSEHELDRLRVLHGDTAVPVPVAVVPLPIDQPVLRPGRDRPRPRREIAVFGFIYPGKGHAEALGALCRLPADLGFTALGRPADGHPDLVSELRAEAFRQGRRFRMAGFIPSRVLIDRLQQVAVPVVPGAAVSASGSLNTWIAAGRRPLVAAGAYARELATRYPGGLHLYRPGELPNLIAATLADPARSWIEVPPPPELLAPAVARAHARGLLRLDPDLVP